MSIPGAASPLFLATTAGAAEAFEISRSLRFNSGDSAYLLKDFASAGNRRTWTWSGWVKRSKLGSIQVVLMATSHVGTTTAAFFKADDTLEFYDYQSGGYTSRLITSQVFRDTSSWFHLVVRWDTTESTSSDRAKIYVNGSQITSFGTGTYPNQNIESRWNNNVTHDIGQENDNNYLDAYLAEVNFIDGQALAPTDFGEFDNNGVWQAKEFTGTYGPLVDQSQTWSNGTMTTGTILGSTSIASAFNNTLSANNGIYTNSGAKLVFTFANTISYTQSVELYAFRGAGNPGNSFFDIGDVTPATNYFSTLNSGPKWITIASGSGTFNAITNQDQQDSGGWSAIKVDGKVLVDSGVTVPDNSFRLPFTDNSSTQALGYDAAVTAPTLNPKGGMDVVTYTGNGGTQSIGGLGFQPDFVWIKSRSNSSSHHLFDVVRGGTKALYSDSTSAENTASNYITSFSSDGFGLGNETGINGSSRTYVAWAWKAAGAAVSNTDGTITSQVSASTDYGFSIVKWTATNGSATIGHGLNTAPAFIFVKDTASSTFWQVYHSSLGNTKAVNLNSSNAESASANHWNNTSPTSTTFSVGLNSNYQTDNHIAYCWSEVAGFSKFGSYSGSSAAGNAQNLGFKPRWVIIKSSTSSTDEWVIFDSARPLDKYLYANSSAAEGSYNHRKIEVSDTGFSFTGSDQAINTSGQTYIYAAFADRPGNNWTPNNLSVFDGTVATAGGALPILNTTGNYGGTVGSGTRADSNSSNIVLALPMNGANGGTTFTDQHATIKGSGSAKTVTVSNVTTSTAQSFFYSSSGLFDSTSDKLTIPTGGSGGDIDFEGVNFTIECWCYANSINSNSAHLVSCWVDPSPLSFLLSMGGGGSQNKFTFGAAGGTATDATARSAGQWYHVAGVRDSNTLRLFVNGEQAATASCSGDVTNPPSDVTVGQMSNNSAANWQGYMSDLRIYKGVAKYTSAFNPPSRSSGLENDSLVDTPSNAATPTDTGVGGEVVGNYCTPNPLNTNSNVGFSDGNLNLNSTAGGWYSCYSTMGISSGKFYWEATAENNSSSALNSLRIGIAPASSNILNSYIGSISDGYGYSQSNGNKYNNGSGSSYGSTLSVGDIVMVAFDADNGKIWWGKNGTWFASGNPASGTNAAFTSIPSNTYVPAFSFDRGRWIVNMGARAFAYTAPSGYKSLNTANLPTPTIADGSLYFDTKLYTGNGGTQQITGYNFSPDFLWIKSRTNPASGYFHHLHDSVRGLSSGFYKNLYSNTTEAENTYPGSTYGGVNSLNSDGFSLANVGSNYHLNNNTTPYVAWTWDGGNGNNTYTVTVSGGKFYIDGVQQPTLTLAEGSTYKFDQADSTNSSHPLRFSTTSDGTHGGGSEYTTGVTTAGTPGSAGAFTQIVIAASAPTLYAYCTNHSGMGFQVNTSDTGGYTIPVGGLNSSVYNQADVWSDDVTTSAGTIQNVTQMFDGDTSTFGNTTGATDPIITFTPTGGISYTSSIRVWLRTGDHQVRLNGGAWVSSTGNPLAGAYVTLATGSGTINTIEVQYTASSNSAINAIEVDGKILIDSGVSVTNVPSIASQVMASPESGFSIVSYNAGLTSSGSESIGHGLNTAPALIIGKDRDDGTHAWRIRPFFLNDNAYDYLEFDTGALAQFNSNDGTMSLPTSTTFDVNWNASVGASNDIIAYCFTPVAGYSAMGSYVGNGSTDGPFIYTGFKTKWLLIKNSSNGGNWNLFDTSRSTYNPTGELLMPNASDSEYSQPPYNDLLSNGFKLRTNDSGKTGLNTNQSGHTYIYYAVSENPFQANGGLAR